MADAQKINSVFSHKIKCDFTKLDTFRANFLDSVSAKSKPFFIFQLSILRPKSLWKLKGNMFPVRMLLIRRKKSKGKYQNNSPTSVISPQKLIQKLYNFTVGKPIEIDCRSGILTSPLWEAAGKPYRN